MKKLSEKISKMFSHPGCEKCNFIGPTLDGSDVIFDCFGKIEEDKCVFLLVWVVVFQRFVLSQEESFNSGFVFNGSQKTNDGVVR